MSRSLVGAGGEKMKSNKPKHTPGPWIAAIDPGITTVDNNKCKVFGAKHSFFAVIDGCEYSEGLANARLIAAAPLMFEALEHIMQTSYDSAFPEAVNNAEKLKKLLNLCGNIASIAIAKARGES